MILRPPPPPYDPDLELIGWLEGEPWTVRLRRWWRSRRR